MKKYLDIRDGSLEDAVKKTAEKNIRVEKVEDPKLGGAPKNYLDVRPGSIESAVSKVVSEETEYQKMFKKELQKAGKSIPQMSDAEKKAFFDKIDSKYSAKDEAYEGYGENVIKAAKMYMKDSSCTYEMACEKYGCSVEEVRKCVESYKKNEELSAAQKKLPPALQKAIAKKMSDKKEAVDNPYAVGMAAAMKKTGDKPPLKKSTVVKAHDIAKAIEKDGAQEKKEKKSYKDMKQETKGRAMTGSKKTPIEVNPKLENIK